MITYSSYLSKDSDLTNNAFIVGFGNSSFELLAGIGVFGVLGFMASQSGEPISEVVADGVGLAFMAFPEIINQFPDRKSTRLNSSHVAISYAVFCLKKKMHIVTIILI